MSTEEQKIKDNKNEIDTDKNEDSSEQESNPQKKVDYAKWAGVTATFLSVFLAFQTYKMDAKLRNTETENGELKNRQEALNMRLEEIKGRVDIDYNFYSEVAATFRQKSQTSNSLNTVFVNEVYDQIHKLQRQRWENYNNLMRYVYGYFPDDPNFGILGIRQILYFEVFYHPSTDSKKIPAEQVKITYRFQDFPPIADDKKLTFKSSFIELAKDVKSWKTATWEIGQMKPGSKITIPIGHMVGPVNSERLAIPIKISWYNPYLKKTEEKTLNFDRIMSELDGKYSGSLIGNVECR